MSAKGCLALVIGSSVITLCAATLSCSDYTEPQAYKYELECAHVIARPYTFDYASWEINAIEDMVNNTLLQIAPSDREIELHNQIESVLKDNNIAIFPPLKFRLEKPPYLMVISPRERIYYLDRILLHKDLSVGEIEKIEARVDQMGLSSLVEELGGLGATYPPLVGISANPKFILDTIIEEWFHQYLAFKPLGFLYVLDSLGINQNPDVIVMNETLVGLVTREVSSEVYSRYYASNEAPKTDIKKLGFDFNTEMRVTRRQVDSLLSQGKIKEAESYMEERRLIFVSRGYNIRKLNQAYFAFHGIYGHDPASVSPVYSDLRQLRAKSPTLKRFLDITSIMTDYASLKKALED